MRKFRMREIFARYPALDEARTSFLADICLAGIRFYEAGYPMIKVMTNEARRLLKEKQPVLFSIYHGRFVGMLDIVEDRKKVTILISRSRDGEVVARIADRFGYSVARGSPAHKAVEGALQLVSAAKAGQSLMLTVDGPRGPIYKVKPGVIRIAEMTGLPLLPFFVNYRKTEFWRGSWDKIVGGYYGSPMLYMIGDPIYVPGELTSDEREFYRQKLESSMNDLRDRANEYWKAVK
jgi:lysophospholipid acyltransferase (LPLAT)-like uncharacterized protein